MADDIPCRGCSRVLSRDETRVAGFSVFAQGDERIDSWFYCRDCHSWTVEEYLDVFVGESRISIRGPFAFEVGSRFVDIIRRCPTPMDKWCECPAHREYGY